MILKDERNNFYAGRLIKKSHFFLSILRLGRIVFSERLEWTDQSFFFSCYALALIVGVILGRLRLPHQPHPSPRAGAHDHWKVLPSSLHCILHCERVLLQRAVFRDMFLHVFLAYFSSGLLPWDYTFNANILCRLPAHVLQRTHGGERKGEREREREREMWLVWKH